MPKIYVAKCDDGPAVPEEERLHASGSMTTIKHLLRDYGGSTWNVYTYAVRADVPSICNIIEGRLPRHDFVEGFRVNEQGQVRSR